MGGMECSCECPVNPDYPTVYRQKIVRARKSYHCCEPPGADYEYVFSVWLCDDKPCISRTCIPCVRIASQFCALHGDLREHLWNCLGFDYVTGRWDETFLPSLGGK